MMKQYVIKIKGGRTINVDVKICEIDYIWNSATCNCENGKYLASIMDDSAIICDYVIDADDETKFIEKKATCKSQNFYILLTFLLITKALLIALVFAVT